MPPRPVEVGDGRVLDLSVHPKRCARLGRHSPLRFTTSEVAAIGHPPGDKRCGSQHPSLACVSSTTCVVIPLLFDEIRTGEGGVDAVLNELMLPSGRCEGR